MGEKRKRKHDNFSKLSRFRDLTADDVAEMSQKDVVALFERLRWPDSDPVCPKCGSIGAWRINARQKRKDGTVVPRPLYRCKATGCRKQFTITSGSALHRNRIPLRRLARAGVQFATAAKGVPALKQSHERGISYRSAFVLQHKLRDAVIPDWTKTPQLRGPLEADLVFTRLHKRPDNNKGRSEEGRHTSRGARQGLLALKQRVRGGVTEVYLVANESQATDIILKRVVKEETIHTDAAPGWSDLESRVRNYQVNHSQRFADWQDGHAVNVNQCESYNARLRRAEMGIYHSLNGPYVLSYAGEIGWRDSQAHAHATMSERFESMLGAVLQAPVSQRWTGYWQRYLRAKP